ncbi:major facilitator superfamily domain-containing protein [Xylaria flabelliformis]|nr:major facilitator superfamily domain-containing protein [Xylaria flabelliformis]
MTSRQHAAERSLHDQTNILPRRRLVWLFLSLALPLLIAFIDQNGIGVTLPTIARDLNAGDTISWAGTSSLIANTTFQMLYGRLSDIFGRKSVYLGAISVLAIATVLCGVAPNATTFYIFRGIAGIGGGGITNLSMIIMSDVVTLEQRGNYQGILGGFIGLGNVVGPFLAAAFITYAKWRAFFWTISPLAVIVGILSFYTLPPYKPMLRFRESAKKIDYGGVLLSFIGIICLLIPISGGGAYFAWKSPMVISMLVLGAISLSLFILWEWKVASLPMIPVQIFRNPTICILLGQHFLLGAVYQAYLYYLPLYLQNPRQYSVIQSAGAVAAMVGAQAVSSMVSGYAISRWRRWKYVICTGFSLSTLGAGLVLRYKRDSSQVMIIGPLVIIGLGIGCSFQPTLVALQSHSTRSRRAVIISSRNFFRCAGGAVGLALSAAILQGVLKRNLPLEYRHLTRNTYSIPKLHGPDSEAVLNAYMDASRAVFILQMTFIITCLLGCIPLKDHGLELPREQHDERGGELAYDQQDSTSTSNSNSTEKIVVGANGSNDRMIGTAENANENG